MTNKEPKLETFYKAIESGDIETAFNTAYYFGVRDAEERIIKLLEKYEVGGSYPDTYNYIPHEQLIALIKESRSQSIRMTLKYLAHLATVELAMNTAVSAIGLSLASKKESRSDSI